MAPIGSALETPYAGTDTLAYYSNYGKSIIDFGAPGGSLELWYILNDQGVDPYTTCTKNGFTTYCYLFDMVLSNGPGNYYRFFRRICGRVISDSFRRSATCHDGPRAERCSPRHGS